MDLRFLVGSKDVIKSSKTNETYTKLCGVLSWRTGPNLEFSRNEPYSFFFKGSDEKIILNKVYVLDTTVTLKDGELKLYVKGLKT